MNKFWLIFFLIILIFEFNLSSLLAQTLKKQPSGFSVFNSQLKSKIKIKKIEIEGSKFTSEIKSIVYPYLNKQASLEQISAIRNIINQFYQNKGYITSFAFIPLQNFAEGVVKIRVVEGELVDIQVKGLSHLSATYVKAKLQKSLNSKPLYLRTLETELQLLQQDPQIERVEAELRPSLEVGSNILFLNVTEAPTTTTTIVTNNDNSPSLGEFGATVAVEKRSLLIGGDRATVQSSFTEGLEQYQIAYGIPLNSEDGILSFSYQNSQSDIIEEPFDDAGIEGEVEQIALLYRQPLFRSLTKEIVTAFTFDVSSVNSFLFSDLPFSFTEGADDGFYQVSALRWNLVWQTRSTKEVLILSSQFNLGLDLFGATNNDGLPDGQFITWRGQGQWVKALDKSRNTQLLMNINVQLTPSELLPLEQFVMGGIGTVRGYRQNLLIADNGIVGSIEMRLPLLDAKSIGLFQLTPFFDFGTVWNNQNQLDSGTLASVGLGLRWTIDNFLQASIDYGIPLVAVKERGNSLSEDGLHFQLQLTPFRF